MLVVGLLLVTVGAVTAWLVRGPRAAAPAATSSGAEARQPAKDSAAEKTAPAPAAKSESLEPMANKSNRMDAPGRAPAPSWEPLCKDYCWKLRACAVTSDDQCKETCVTVLSSGADPTSHRCVVSKKKCSEISNCGF